MTQPYVDTERNLPDSIGDRCEMCRDEFGPLMVGPCWSEARGFWTGTRCVDGLLCRQRIAHPLEPAIPNPPAPEGDPDALDYLG